MHFLAKGKETTTLETENQRMVRRGRVASWGTQVVEYSLVQRSIWGNVYNTGGPRRLVHLVQPGGVCQRGPLTRVANNFSAWVEVGEGVHFDVRVG